MFKAQGKVLFCFLLLIVVGCSEKEGELIENQEYYSDYTEPDYPAKESGKYISSLHLDVSIHMGGNGTSEINMLEGTKVMFNYNQKNYVKTIELFGDNNQLYRTKEVEYNNHGKAYRIKNINVNKGIDSYIKFEYDSFDRLVKMGFYENTNSNNIFELSNLSEFEYPSEDTIVKYFPQKSNNFKRSNYIKYVLDSIGNITYELYYVKGSGLPYITGYLYSDNHRLYSETGLPNFDFPWGVSDNETFSKTALLGSQKYKYISKDEFLPVGDIVYDNSITYSCSDGYPIRIGSSVSVIYIDL
jgi:hypothetical protein